MTTDTTLRVARPTDRLEQVVAFYTEGLALGLLGSFEDHEGFDGVLVGLPGDRYHLEFTRSRNHTAGPPPTAEHLLVFYMPDQERWRHSVNRMQAAGHRAVPSSNPYWDGIGMTFEDPDGCRVVLANQRWSS